jgi:hypothetical protein
VMDSIPNVSPYWTDHQPTQDSLLGMVAYVYGFKGVRVDHVFPNWSKRLAVVSPQDEEDIMMPISFLSQVACLNHLSDLRRNYKSRRAVWDAMTTKPTLDDQAYASCVDEK